MAQRVTTTLLDDLDGGDADVTIRFGLEGKSYEIDLNRKNAEKLRRALAPFIQGARPERRVVSSRSSLARSSVAVGPDPKAVRAWAEANGVAVPSRGRVPASVIEQFRASGN